MSDYVCIASRVWNYTQMSVKKLQAQGRWGFYGEDIQCDLKGIEEVYKNARVDDILTDVNPMSCAAGLVYFYAIKTGIFVTQREVVESFIGIKKLTSISVRTHYKRFNAWYEGKKIGKTLYKYQSKSNRSSRQKRSS